VLVELAAGLRVTRCLEIAFGFASAMQNTIGRRALLLALPFRSLARFTKFDDVTHPELGHQACEASSLVGRFLDPKCARSVAIAVDPRTIAAV
jgi:hypothetical protein